MLNIGEFFEQPQPTVGPIANERALQLELAFYLRNNGYRVEFEKTFGVQSLPLSTRKPKQNLDLLVFDQGSAIGIELKVPLAGRVPETMYDFCADVEFVEGLTRLKFIDRGLCVLVTNNRQFWQSKPPTCDIYGFFRNADALLTGCITKPTGAKDSAVVVGGQYRLGTLWRDLGNHHLMERGRYLLVDVLPANCGRFSPSTD
jgi:hypothetical protein